MKSIGEVYNYYGGIWVYKKGDKCYWFIENHDTDMDNIDMEDVEEIPPYLYDALIKFEDEDKRKPNN